MKSINAYVFRLSEMIYEYKILLTNTLGPILH
jgi:hypothetical protein